MNARRRKSHRPDYKIRCSNGLVPKRVDELRRVSFEPSNQLKCPASAQLRPRSTTVLYGPISEEDDDQLMPLDGGAFRPRSQT